MHLLCMYVQRSISNLHFHKCIETRHARLLIQAPGDCVLVVGATGGVGQVLTGKLLEVHTF